MGIPIEDLKKKKETLMTAFRNNLKKKKESIRSGSGLDDIYTPSWQFYDVMESFLKDVYECKSVINTEDGATISSHDEDSVTQNENVENIDPNAGTEHIKIPIRRRRSRNPPELEETDQEMKKAFSTLNNILDKQKTKDFEDDCDIYAKLLARKLRQFNDTEKQELMYEIDGILLKKRQNLNRQRTSHYVVQSPSQIIISTNNSIRGRTRTSTPLASQTYIPYTSSLNAYSSSTTANDAARPRSNLTVYSEPCFSHNVDTTSEEETPIEISIPEQRFFPNLETEQLQSQGVLRQAYVDANIDETYE